MPRIFVPQLNRHIVFPDSMPREEIRGHIQRLIDSQSPQRQIPEVPQAQAQDSFLGGLGEAMAGGFRQGASLVPEVGERVADLVGADRAQGWLDVKGKELAGDFVPDTLPEKIVHGVSQVPGVVAASAPFLALGAAIVPEALAGSALGAAMAGAAGFGGFEALLGSEHGARGALEGGVRGAVTGGLFGATGFGAGLINNPATARAVHAAGLGAIGAGGAALEGAPLEDVIAGGVSMAALGGLSRGQVPGFKRLAKATGVTELKAKSMIEQVKQFKKKGVPGERVKEWIDEDLTRYFQSRRAREQEDIFTLSDKKIGDIIEPPAEKLWESEDPFNANITLDEVIFGPIGGKGSPFEEIAWGKDPSADVTAPTGFEFAAPYTGDPKPDFPGSRVGPTGEGLPSYKNYKHFTTPGMEIGGPGGGIEGGKAPSRLDPYVKPGFPKIDPTKEGPLSASDVAKEAANIFGFSLFDKSIPRGALGWAHAIVTDISGGIVNVADMMNLPIVFHEMGHQVHRMLGEQIAPGSLKGPMTNKARREYLGMMEIAPTPVKSELAAAALKNFGEGTYKADRLVSEGFAEYLAEFTMREPPKSMPHTNAWFSQMMAERPDVYARLAHMRKVTHRWAKQSSLDKARADSLDSPYMSIQDRLDPKRLSLLARQNMVDSASWVKDLVGNKLEASNPLDNPYMLLRFGRGAHSAQAEAALTVGLYNIYGGGATPIARSVKSILEDAGVSLSNMGEYRDFMSFMRAIRVQEKTLQGTDFGVAGQTLGAKRPKPSDPLPQQMTEAFLAGKEIPSLGSFSHEFVLEGKLGKELLQKYGPDRIKSWGKRAKEFNQFGNGLLKMMVDAGVMDKKTSARIMKKNDWWIPLQRWVKETEGPLGNDVFRAIGGGSGQKFVDPMIALSNTVERMFSMANHSRTMTSFIKFLEKHPNHGVKELHSKNVGANFRYLDDGNVVKFRKNGKDVYYQLPDQAYQAIKATDNYTVPNKFMDLVFGGPKRMVTLGYTGLNVGFQIITNPVRDLFVRVLQTDLSRGDSPLQALVASAEAVKTSGETLIPALKATFYEQTGGAIGKESWAPSPEYKRYMASGAKIAGPVWSDLRNAIALRDSLLVNKAGGGSGANFRKNFARHPIDVMRRILSWSEDVNRLPEFKIQERIHGPGTAEAFLSGQVAASDVTLDFRRMGAYSRWINEYVPFFNATIQGADKFARTIKENPGAALLRGGLMVTAPMMTLWAINKDERWYQELPLWEKMVFAHFKIGDEIIRLPLPFEWGIMFGSLPVSQMDAIYQKSPERAKQSIRQAFEVLAPDILPTTFKVPVEMIANKDMFRNVPLESRAMQRLRSEERYRKTTPGIYKAIGQISGKAGVSPIMAQHLVEGFTGGLSRELANTIDIAMDPASFGKDDLPLARQPIIGRLVSNQDRPGQSVNDFYEQLNKMERAFNSAKLLAKEGDHDRAYEILKRNQRLLNLTDAQVRALSRSRNMARPVLLTRMTAWSRKMAKLRKEDEPDLMTDFARRALGRGIE